MFIEVGVDIYPCFIDYEKAFDKMKHKLMFILEKIGVDAAESRIINNLYWYQEAKVKINNEYS